MGNSNLVTLDDETIKNMVELGNGDEDFCNRLLIVQLMSVYLNNLPERIKELTEAIKSKNAQIIERSAHTLKSSSRLIGFLNLAEYCQKLEDIGYSKKLDGSDILYKEIHSASEEIPTILKNKIKELES